MAQVKLDLSANTAYTGLTILPTGIYNMEISKSDVKETKAGGHMLELNYKVIDGEHEGKAIVHRVNIAHSNPDVVKYGLNELKTIMTVGGHNNPNFLADTDELLGLKLKISLEEEIQMKDGQPVTNEQGKPYRENRIKGTFKYDGASSESKTAPKAEEKVESTEPPKPAPKSENSYPWNS